MNQRRVRFTATAQRHIKLEKDWWFENRDHTDIFASEVEEGVRLMSLLPAAGSIYSQTGVAGLRRVYLRKLACHFYYTYDDDEVVVRALWGARRRRGPRLKP